MRGQAVHEQRVGVRLRHQAGVDLIAAQLVVAPFLGGLGIVHRHPGVGHDQVGAPDGAGRVTLDLGLDALGAGEVDPFRLGVQRRRAGEGEVEPELPRRLDQRGADVVAVAGPHHLAPGDRAAMFLVGHHVGHDLAGMGAVGQPVDDRHGGVFGHLEQRRFLEGADHDEIDVTAQHPGGVGDGLAVAQLHLLARQHHRLPAHLPHAEVEADPGAGRGLFEDQRHHPVLQRLVGVGGALGGAVAGVLHRAGAVDDRPQVGFRGRVDVEEAGH